jgi:hypothetical protein
MLRRDQLCPGPGNCNYVLMENPRATSDSLRCEECPLSRLEEGLGTLAGQLAIQTIDLSFALEAGVAISPKDITFPEWILLHFLSEERHRFQEETTRRGHERPVVPTLVDRPRRAYGGK